MGASGQWLGLLHARQHVRNIRGMSERVRKIVAAEGRRYERDNLT